MCPLAITEPVDGPSLEPRTPTDTHARTCAQAPVRTNKHSHATYPDTRTHTHTRAHWAYAVPRARTHRRSPPAAVIGFVFVSRRRETPLHRAAANGKYDVVTLLVASRAGVSTRDKRGSVEYSRRGCPYFVFVTPSGALPAAVFGIDVLTWMGRAIVRETMSHRFCVRSLLVAHSAPQLCSGRTRRCRYGPAPNVTGGNAHRLSRKLPRDHASDKSAFDAAVKARRPFVRSRGDRCAESNPSVRAMMSAPAGRLRGRRVERLVSVRRRHRP